MSGHAIHIFTRQGACSLGGCMYVTSIWNRCLYTSVTLGTTHTLNQEASVQFCSVTQLCPTLCNLSDCSTPGFPVHHQLPESTKIHLHLVGDAMQPSHPLSSPFSPTFALSKHEDYFKWVSSLIRWPKYWNFSFSISPSNEYSGPITFRMDWLDLLAVQGTLKSSPTPQFKSINSLVLSFLYSPTLTSIHDHWKNHSLESNVSAF